jgi:hypothetical protein
MNYFDAGSLYEQLFNSPQYAVLGEDLESEEEKRKRRAALGNYSQQQTMPDPQVNTGYSERTPNLFNMFYL